MELTMLPVLAASLDSMLYILFVALGLGLVIFFHELGHFAVAKWCNVHVERFSIGFGPILLSRKYGETEYALSAIPFGGYVKMLGQDDMDPSQLSSEEIARNPRSYSAKSVPQRMAIISAGVIMNVLTAVIFFGVAFGIGIDQSPSVLGQVLTGKPAWVAGLREGDRITNINGRDIDSFGDIMRGVALSTGDVRMQGVRPDNTTFDVTITPEVDKRRMIGVVPSSSTRLAKVKDAPEPAFPGTSAADANPEFQPHDVVRKVDGVEVRSFYQLADQFARKRDIPLSLEVERKEGEGTKLLTIVVPPNPFRSLGLLMDIGKISSIQKDSPADREGLKVDDKITRVGDKAVGTDLNPLDLPDHFASLQGQKVDVTVLRAVVGAEAKEITVRLEPEDRPGWIERPLTEDAPLSVPAIGVAFPIVPTVLKVEPGSPAEEAKILPKERVREVKLVRMAGSPVDPIKLDELKVTLGAKADAPNKRETNWAFAWWMMQELPARKVILVVSDEAGKPREVTIKPAAAREGSRFSPDRGLWLAPQSETVKAETLGDAMSLGMTHTRNTIVDIYLTLRNLITGDVSVKELHGPVTIAVVAYEAVQHGFAQLMLFLGLLSVNLAVINFLPIPVLDGGHMVFLTWEAITRKKPSERVLIAAQYFGMAFVLGLMMLVLYLDLFYHAKGN